MVALAINQLIKLILGILVVVAVISALYFAFKNNILDFFENLGGNETIKLILGLL